MISMRKKRKIKNGTSGFFVVMFVLIPLLGIFLGYIATQKIIVPYMSQNEQVVSQNSADSNGSESSTIEEIKGEESEPVFAYQKMFDIDGFNLYRIQVGAFSSEENALKLVNELKIKGIATILKEEGLYKVFVYYAFEEDLAKKQLEKFRKYLPQDVHVSRISYPSIGIGFPESMAYQADIIWGQLRQVREMIERTTHTIAAGENAGTLVSEQQAKIDDFKHQLKELELSPPLIEYGNQMQNMYTAMLDAYSHYNVHKNEYDQLSIVLMDCFINFIDKLNSML